MIELMVKVATANGSVTQVVVIDPEDWDTMRTFTLQRLGLVIDRCAQGAADRAERAQAVDP